MIHERQSHVKGSSREVTFYDLVGVSTLDYMDLYKHPSFNSSANQESYKLDYIGFVELGENKLDYSEYGSLTQLYKQNHQKFIDYNIKDVELVVKLEDKLKLIELAISLAYDSHVNFDDVFSQTRMWDSIIYGNLLAKNIIIPPKKNSHKHTQFEGAHVKSSLAGYHRWVVSFDLTSLYPKLIEHHNISPETMVDLADPKYRELREWVDDNRKLITVNNLLSKSLDLSILNRFNVTMTGNGQFFTRERKGFMPELMSKFFDIRAMNKRKMLEARTAAEKEVDVAVKKTLEKDASRYNNAQSSRKICINSLFGVCGSPHFRFFDIRLAEAITLSAQLSIRWIANHINELLNKTIGSVDVDYIIASDTDSIFINLEQLMKKLHKNWDGKPTPECIELMNQVCKQVFLPFINKCFLELSDYMNAYECKMEMKRESLADAGIWTAKKNYFLRVWDAEGVRYNKPKIKITGLAAIRSSTPAVARKKLKEIFDLILNGDYKVVNQFIQDFRAEFNGLNPADIAFPRSINGLDTYGSDKTIWKSKTPPQVKGALVYNRLLKKLKLTNQYEAVKEGEKAKFIYLREPNPIQSTVISFQTVLPREFDIMDYLDYDSMYQKAFLDPLKDIMGAMGWGVDMNQSSLEDMFA
jgi:DNA polymerase elongation subunit (family B)